MTKEELLEKLNEIQISRCETQTTEIKAAFSGCPKRLYDTLSSFSNQDDGGIIVFGIDEEDDFRECGVYDPQDLQKKVNEQCLQMEPVVRPLLTVVQKDGRFFVAAEIPGIDLAERPCYYKGRGRLKGSYTRVGDSDEPMTEYEVYRYEAFRKKYRDDIRPVPRASLLSLQDGLLRYYLQRVREGRPNLSALPDEQLYELTNILRDGVVTLSSVLLFSGYPQTYFPQLCITAVSVAGEKVGDVGEFGERFITSRRIEGNIEQMLEQAMAFVRQNTRTSITIDPKTGKREDRPDYPITAVREILVNALAHRDYSEQTEGMPIQILLFSDRMEVRSPGGIYGRLSVEQLGKMQPDTRNPVLVNAMELLGLTENRYSGIPTIRRVLQEAGLPEPVFEDQRGTFVVTIYNVRNGTVTAPEEGRADTGQSRQEAELLQFLQQPRSRAQIAEHLKISTVAYAIRKYIDPLIARGLVRRTIPDRPRSEKQRFVRTDAAE